MRVRGGVERGAEPPSPEGRRDAAPPRVYAGESRGGRSPLLQMNFDFTDREETFRKEVRAWLEANLPDGLRGRAFAASRADRDEVRRLRAWQKRMCEAGYVGLDWPKEIGGRGASDVRRGVLYQGEARAEAPQLVNRGGGSMLGPTLMKHGAAAEQARVLARILAAGGVLC